MLAVIAFIEETNRNQVISEVGHKSRVSRPVKFALGQTFLYYLVVWFEIWSKGKELEYHGCYIEKRSQGLIEPLSEYRLRVLKTQSLV